MDTATAPSVLSGDEVERAARLRTTKGREGFGASRIALRRILSQYLATTPDRVTFEYGASGKPRLAVDPYEKPRVPPLSFNISHSGGVALCAVAESTAVGVDIERVRELRDFERLAERHFSAAERARCTSAGNGPAVSEFFRVWTRKEALLKAAGLGLSRPLDRVDTEHGVLDEVTYWLEDLLPGEGFAAAVACARAPSEIRLFSWAEPG